MTARVVEQYLDLNPVIAAYTALTGQCPVHPFKKAKAAACNQ